MASEPTARQILELEGRFYRHAGAKEAAIREDLDLSAVRFYQRLREICLDPAPDVAVQFGPLIGRTLRKMEWRVKQLRAG